MDVPKIDSRVEIDAAVLRSVDAVAEQLGSSRDQVIEDSVRRGLAARTLGDVLTRVCNRSDLTEEQAAEVAYGEVKAARADRRACRDQATPDRSSR